MCWFCSDIISSRLASVKTKFRRNDTRVATASAEDMTAAVADDIRAEDDNPI